MSQHDKRQNPTMPETLSRPTSLKSSRLYPRHNPLQPGHASYCQDLSSHDQPEIFRVSTWLWPDRPNYFAFTPLSQHDNRPLATYARNFSRTDQPEIFAFKPMSQHDTTLEAASDNFGYNSEQHIQRQHDKFWIFWLFCNSPIHPKKKQFFFLKNKLKLKLKLKINI